MDVIVAPLSGRIYTDSLIKGPKWSSLALTFSFPTSAGEFTGYVDGEPFSNFEALNATQQAAARAIFAQIASFTNLTFSELTGGSASTAVLRFGMTDATATAHGYYPDAAETGGDTWYRNTGGQYDNPVRGNYAWDTILHELGHALGLGHPHQSPTPMPGDRDWMPYTVMSYRSTANAADELGYYNEEWSFPQTYMMEDIAALQFLYGANYNFNAGDTTYHWNELTGEMSVDGVGQGVPGGNRVFDTIWDGGGIDTYDFSNYSAYASIDLRPGAWNMVSNSQKASLGGGGMPPGNVANAMLFNADPRSLIENAIGTNGDDQIYGNDIANVLTGGPGSDTIHGLLGDDTLHGNAGIDWLYGEEGNDTLYGGDNVDLLYAGAGNDTLYGGDEADQMGGEDGDDWLEGGAGNDGMGGGAGNDHLDGGDGHDSLNGGPGDDTLVGGDGNDDLGGYFGIDVMTGGLGDDSYGVDDIGDVVNEIEGQGVDTVAATISYVASSAIENVKLKDWTFFEYGGPPPPTGPIDATGNALANVLEGNSEANILLGLGGADDLRGGSGNDVLDGGTGADLMTGGGGDDTFYVDDPGDVVNDTDYYEPTFQTHYVGGNDTVYSSISYALPSTPAANPNSDPYGGASLILGTTTYTVETLILTGTADLNGFGSDIGNSLYGNSGRNILDGKAGNDVLTGNLGGDEMSGGAGADVFRYVSVDDSTAAQYDWLRDFEHGTDLIDLRDVPITSYSFNVEGNGTQTWLSLGTAAGATMLILVAGQATAADLLLAEIPGVTLTGTDGDDVLDGTFGNDTFLGGPGNDTMVGRFGNDVFFVDAGDVVFEAANDGNDRVVASTNYALGAGQYIETLETLTYTGTGAINLTGSDIANTIYGNNGINQLFGQGGTDTIHGFGGNDYLFGGTEFDNLYGGTGDDAFYIATADGDRIWESAGEGYDTVSTEVDYELPDTAFVERLEAGTLSATTALYLGGSNQDNLIIGNAGNNTLRGFAGADTLHGLAGDDILIGDQGADVMYGGAGNDTYYVSTGDDRVFENPGEGTSDRVATSVSFALPGEAEVETLEAVNLGSTTQLILIGSNSANTIVGNAGANVLDGKGGNDLLTGAGGADTFAFSTTPGAGNVDQIVDFAPGSDKIRLDDAVFAGLPTGSLAAGAFVIGASAQDADDRIVYDGATGALYYDADGNGAGAAIQFATLSGAPSLTAADFLVI